MEGVIKPVIPSTLMKEGTTIIINGTGRFIIGGPQGDAGLTGRKIIVDTYGGIGRHGGGAFSGKDPSKVDRSGAYMARWVAKHIVASGLAEICEIQLSYAIGVAEPVNISININTFNTSKVSNQILEEIIKIGIAVDCIPTPSPAIIFVAAPVIDCLAIDCTGLVPVPV